MYDCAYAALSPNIAGDVEVLDPVATLNVL